MESCSVSAVLVPPLQSLVLPPTHPSSLPDLISDFSAAAGHTPATLAFCCFLPGGLSPGCSLCLEHFPQYPQSSLPPSGLCPNVTFSVRPLSLLNSIFSIPLSPLLCFVFLHSIYYHVTYLLTAPPNCQLNESIGTFVPVLVEQLLACGRCGISYFMNEFVWGAALSEDGWLSAFGVWVACRHSHKAATVCVCRGENTPSVQAVLRPACTIRASGHLAFCWPRQWLIRAACMQVA